MRQRADRRAEDRKILRIPQSVAALLTEPKRQWLLAMGTFWVFYVAYASTTSTKVYGVDQWQVALIRIAIASAWLLIAAALLIRRLQEPRLTGFLPAALILLPPLLFAWVAFEGSKWPGAFLGMAVSYAMINGFLCLTIQTAWRAALAGLLVVVAQLMVDAFVHLFAGTLRFH